MTVQADVAPGIQAATVVQALAPKIEALNASLPSGYHIDVGGTVEESSKAQASVAAVLPLMLILILTVLMIQLQSFNRLFLVLSVAPLGLIGVVAALLLADKPLGFVAILGVLALTGMIARNSVILIDQIEKEKAHGRHPWDAVVEATTHRFRPILLTAAAAILGMIPIAPTIFWGPMAYAIMGGLAVATLLTLVFLPALYVTWFRIKAPAARDPRCQTRRILEQIRHGPALPEARAVDDVPKARTAQRICWQLLEATCTSIQLSWARSRRSWGPSWAAAPHWSRPSTPSAAKIASSASQ